MPPSPRGGAAAAGDAAPLIDRRTTSCACGAEERGRPAAASATLAAPLSAAPGAPIWRAPAHRRHPPPIAAAAASPAPVPARPQREAEEASTPRPTADATPGLLSRAWAWATGGDDDVTASADDIETATPASAPPQRAKSVDAPPSSRPACCLICLDPLTKEDFETGAAIALACACRGDLALRHRACADRWAAVKGDRVCDVCRVPVANLADPPPRRDEAADALAAGAGVLPGAAFAAWHAAGDARHPHALYHPDALPGPADAAFDCVRVTWVSVVACALFLDMSLPAALWAGLAVGAAYALAVRAVYASHVAALRRGAAAAAGAAAEAGARRAPMVVAV